MAAIEGSWPESHSPFSPYNAVLMTAPESARYFVYVATAGYDGQKAREGKKDMAISNETLDALMKDYQKPEDLLGSKGLLKQLTRRLLEKAMEGEVTHHLG